jgi:hypothetical protein
VCPASRGRLDRQGHLSAFYDSFLVICFMSLQKLIDQRRTHNLAMKIALDSTTA